MPCSLSRSGPRPPDNPKRTANVDDTRLLNAAKEPQNWMIYGGGWSEQHYSPLKSIDAANVSRLKPAWSFDFDTYRGQEATPVVVDGVMYVSSAWSKVFALGREDRQAALVV